MKRKLSLKIMVLTSAFISAMEIGSPELALNGMLLEPASLLFQAIWCAVANGEDLKVVGEENIVSLGDKIKVLQEIDRCTSLEKKLFINLLNNFDLDDVIIKNNFMDLFEEYLEGQKFENKQQLLNAMLCASAERGEPEVLLFLIDLGANINAIAGSIQYTPLMFAIMWGYEEIIEILIEAGADVNVKGSKIGKATALLCALDCCASKEIIESLLDAGADINVRNKWGMNALDLAIARDYLSVIPMIKAAMHK